MYIYICIVFFPFFFVCFLKTNKCLKCIVCKYGKKRTERKRNIWIAIQKKKEETSKQNEDKEECAEFRLC